jgi:hypothetical protein
VIEGIQEAINRDTALASYVKCITLEQSRRQRPVPSNVLNAPLWTLTSQLPSLHIFICPGRYACGMAKSSLDIVVWKLHTHPEIYRKILEQTTYLQNTRLLSISFGTGNPIQFDWNPVLFPRLESLYLPVYTLQTIDQLTRSWEIPNLHILSIKSICAIYWLDFIEKWGTKIDILELSNELFEWPRTIQLPNLKELRVNERLWTSYRMAAPKLDRFSLISSDAFSAPVREDALRAVNHARASFPGLRRLRFRGMEGDSYRGETFIPLTEPSDYDLTSQDIRSWAEAGLEVDVLSS